MLNMLNNPDNVLYLTIFKFAPRYYILHTHSQSLIRFIRQSPTIVFNSQTACLKLICDISCIFIVLWTISCLVW